jgi:hypothetical protein
MPSRCGCSPPKQKFVRPGSKNGPTVQGARVIHRTVLIIRAEDALLSACALGVIAPTAGNVPDLLSGHRVELGRQLHGSRGFFTSMPGPWLDYDRDAVRACSLMTAPAWAGRLARPRSVHMARQRIPQRLIFAISRDDDAVPSRGANLYVRRIAPDRRLVRVGEASFGCEVASVRISGLRLCSGGRRRR